MFAWFKSWKERQKLKKLMRLMLPLLRKRYGTMEFYSEGQVLKSAELAHLNRAQTFCAIAMFIKPGEALDTLRKMGSLETYEQIRKRLLELCFNEYREDNFEENWFVCAEASSGGSGGGGHDSGGHSGGDSGGGQH